MDILDKLKQQVKICQKHNTQFVQFYNIDEITQEAAHEIERLRKVIDSDIDVSENYFEGIEDIKQDLEDFADNPPVGDLEHDRVRIAGMADQCDDILTLLEKTMHHRKTTSEFLISFMEIMNDHGIDPSSTDIINAWKRAENKKVTALEEEIEKLRKQVEAMQWRDIETAPSSQNPSQRFMAHVPGHGATICWKNYSGYIWNVYTDNSITKATHWMPLPPAPEE